jgi:outer membrane murein-binding lipoprotein Lpp
MNKLIVAVLSIAVVSLSGCGDKEAREYASKLVPVLDSYQEQLSSKIKAERESYGELADSYEEARQEDISLRLSMERRNRSEALAEELITSSNAPRLANIIGPLKEYAKLDFDTTRTLLDEQMDSRSKYLADLESLEIEAQKIKALKESLEDLAKSKASFKKFKGTADFIAKTEEGMNTLLCADFKKQIEELKASKAGLEKQLDDLDDNEKKPVSAKIKTLALKIAQTEERSKARKCA